MKHIGTKAGWALACVMCVTLTPRTSAQSTNTYIADWEGTNQLIPTTQSELPLLLDNQQKPMFKLDVPMLLLRASALPQCADSAKQASIRPERQSPKWTRADEVTLLAKAQRGDSSTQMWLASAYEQGWFGAINYPEALKWFRRSAEQGDPDAQNSLGQIYENGEGVTQNYALAAG
jgi:hypothetical protein